MAPEAENTQLSQSPRVHWQWLLGLLVLTVALRVPGIERPLTGNFATKNVVYAMIARNWALGRGGLLEPTLDCMVGGQRSLHLLEFPVSAYMSGLAWKCLGGSLDVWGRLTALGFTLGAVALLVLLATRWHGPDVGLVSGLAMAVSPVSIFYGRSFMLEASLMCFVLATLWAWDHWLTAGRWLWLVVACLALSLALLTKIFMLVLLAPMIAMAWRAKPAKTLAGAIAVIAAILPAAAWYWYAAAAASPESPLASRVYYSVRASAGVHFPPHPLLWTASFYFRLLRDLAGPVLTPIGFGLAAAGLLSPLARRHWAWLVASVVLVLLLPRKFHEMNYYWLAVLPLLAILAGLGWPAVRERTTDRRLVAVALVLLWIAVSVGLADGPVRRIAEEDQGVVAAGTAVQGLTRADEPVAAMHGTTIDLLYYCQRPGWAVDPSNPAALAGCFRQGARVLAVASAEPVVAPVWPGVVVSPLARGPGYAVYRLVGP